MFIVCLSASWLTLAGQEAREPARPCCISGCMCLSTENIFLHRCLAIFYVGSMYTCARTRTCCRTLHPEGKYGAYVVAQHRRYRPEKARVCGTSENKICKPLPKARGALPNSPKPPSFPSARTHRSNPATLPYPDKVGRKTLKEGL
mgnify:CR=1 FL=1